MKTLKNKIVAGRSLKAHRKEDRCSYKVKEQATPVRVKGGRRFGKKWFPHTKAE